MYSPKKVVSLCIALLGLAAVAVIVTTGTVAATPRLNTMAAAPTSPSIPVAVTNTPLPVTGTLSVGGSVNANITNSALNVANSAATPLFAEDVNKTAAHLVSDGKAFDFPPNPNVAFEFDLPTNVVLTDVELSLNAPAQAATLFVADQSDKTFIFQTTGSPGSTYAVSTDGHISIHLQSGLYSSIGLRVGLYCNNVGGNSCAGALMWSGYQP
jgi:hypothetical protein